MKKLSGDESRWRVPACSVQNFLAYRLVSRDVKVNIYRTIILFVLYGCETWSLTLRENADRKCLRTGR
jgi:hypothetical protein